jgi:nitrite reductase/ring-hydroxylating ferredoxin subunit
MSTPAIPYVICNLDDIPNRRAKAFQLVRRDNDGAEKAFSIFVVRWGTRVFGYINQCPHNSVNLDWERNQFLDPSGLRLMCGKHGALFEIGTGRCVDGPCQGERLEPVNVSVLDGDICISGVELIEADETHVPEAAEGARS